MADLFFENLRRPWIENKTLAQVTEDVAGTLDAKASPLWWYAFIPSLLLLALGTAAVTYLLFTGVGVLGLNRTVGWAVFITSFVWWIGIGHAGTLISAILYLFRQKWRTSINRSAEAMTLFAVICAGLFPVIHTGRPWFAFWLFPYPNTRGSVWPNLQSPLCWDVFAVSTYLTVSFLFWYQGLVPDLATVRDRLAGGIRKKIFGVLSFGWTGSTRDWNQYELAYLILAGLATPLVLSVHSIVSFDFAVSILPGWHSTIFPPYFVAGAIFSGFAMVLTLLIIARVTMNLQAYITLRHIDAMSQILLLTGCMVGLSYAIEAFTAWYGGDRYEQFNALNRAFGPMAWTYWLTIFCNVLAPQALWSSRLRRNIPVVFVISILVNIGMWFERFVIIVTSLYQDFLPSAWRQGYHPTIVEISVYLGTFGLFLTAFLLFCRFLPMIAISEVKHEVAAAGLHGESTHEQTAPVGNL